MDRMLKELEEEYKKWAQVGMKILRAYQESGTHMPQEKWVAKYLPDQLENF